MEKILVALDFSEVTVDVLERGSRLARALPAKLWLVNVGSPEVGDPGAGRRRRRDRERVTLQLSDEHRRTQQAAQKLRRSGLDVTALCRHGAPVKTILHEAEELGADLIILGSHGRSALYRSLLGSVSEGVLRRAPCPVMIVPAEGERGMSWPRSSAAFGRP